MGERLSVTTAIIGLLAVGGKTMEKIWDLNLPATKLTPALGRALQEVKQCRSTVHLLYKTLCLLEAARLPFAERAAWIDVDELMSTLTDTVLAFSDLQAVCDELDQQRGPGSVAVGPGPVAVGPGPATVGPGPAAVGPGPAAVGPDAASGYGQRIGALCSRIRWQSLSMNLMMTILKCPSQVDAQNASVALHRRLTRILTSDTALSHRMRFLQGASNGAVIMDRNAPPHYSVSDPEAPPPSSPPRSAPPRPAPPSRPAPSDPDSPAPYRSRAASPFSGYTLADIPVMSIVSLPVTTDELRDGSDVYTAAYARRMGRHLGQLAWNAELQSAGKTPEAIRGWTDADYTGDSTTGAENVHVADAPPAKKPRFYSIRVKRRCRACR